jgi:hypothetical protein
MAELPPPQVPGEPSRRPSPPAPADPFAAPPSAGPPTQPLAPRSSLAPGGLTPPPGWGSTSAPPGEPPKKTSRTPLFVGLGVVAAIAAGGVVIATRGSDDSGRGEQPAATEAASGDTASDDAEPGGSGNHPEVSVPDSLLDITIPTGGSTPSGPGSSPNDALAANSPFNYSDEFVDAEWAGLMLGMVEVPTAEFADPGRCLVVIGSIRPTRSEGVISSGFFAPTISLISEGRVVDSTFAECDTSGLEAAGYSWILDAQVTVGTDFPFFSEFFFAGDTLPPVENILVGDTASSNIIYFEATVLDATPPPPLTAIGGLAVTPQPVGTPFSWGDSFATTKWDGVVQGIVEVPVGGFTEGGACIAIVGTITATATEGGITNGFDTPNLSVISRGRQILNTFGSCDLSAVEAAGYRWISDAQVTVGTSYPFYAELYLEGGPLPTIDAIVVGEASLADALYFEPTVLPGVPTP